MLSRESRVPERKPRACTVAVVGDTSVAKTDVLCFQMALLDLYGGLRGLMWLGKPICGSRTASCGEPTISISTYDQR